MFHPHQGIGQKCNAKVQPTDLAEMILRNGYSAIIRGDNQTVIERVGDSFRGTVRCIYIDPPYNNLEAWSHYDDTDTHEVWLAKVVSHISKLRDLLVEDGSIWISIDDRQVHYLKVALDAVFGRDNFVSTVIWEHRKTRENRKVFSNNHEYLLVYARSAAAFRKTRGTLPHNAETLSRYKNPDGDPRGPWQSISLNVQDGHATQSQFYCVVAPSGKVHVPPNGRCWAFTEERLRKEIADGRIWFGKSGNAVPRFKKFLAESKRGLTPHTLWRADEVGTTDSAKKHLLRIFPTDPVFDTPKPEALIRRILEIASRPGDLVCDSYLGSGTTASAAFETGRRFIGIEESETAVDFSLRRLSMAGQPRDADPSRRVVYLDWSSSRTMNKKLAKTSR